MIAVENTAVDQSGSEDAARGNIWIGCVAQDWVCRAFSHDADQQCTTASAEVHNTTLLDTWTPSCNTSRSRGKSAGYFASAGLEASMYIRESLSLSMLRIEMLRTETAQFRYPKHASSTHTGKLSTDSVTETSRRKRVNIHNIQRQKSGLIAGDFGSYLAREMQVPKGKCK